MVLQVGKSPKRSDNDLMRWRTEAKDAPECCATVSVWEGGPVARFPFDRVYLVSFACTIIVPRWYSPPSPTVASLVEALPLENLGAGETAEELGCGYLA